jgi:hypothetical protein
MTIDKLSDLRKLIRLCKSEGVHMVKIDNIELAISLGHIRPSKTSTISDLNLPPEALAKVPTYQPIPITEASDYGLSPSNDKIDTPDDLTEEELLFYSTGPDDN